MQQHVQSISTIASPSWHDPCLKKSSTNLALKTLFEKSFSPSGHVPLNRPIARRTRLNILLALRTRPTQPPHRRRVLTSSSPSGRVPLNRPIALRTRLKILLAPSVLRGSRKAKRKKQGNDDKNQPPGNAAAIAAIVPRCSVPNNLG